jgi:hypothetical protein
MPNNASQQAALQNFVAFSNQVAANANAPAQAAGFNAAGTPAQGGQPLGPNAGKVGVGAQAAAGGVQNASNQIAAASANVPASGATPKQQSTTINNIGDAVSAVGNAVPDRVQSLATSIESWPTPGGIAILLFILFLFIWAVIPVNGNLTRAQLLYLTLTGKTYLPQGAEPGVLDAANQAFNGSTGAPTGPPVTSKQLSYMVGGGTIAQPSNGVAIPLPDFTVA